MKQIYDLLETIEQDKLLIAKLKKQFHDAESILNAHTIALTRLTTIPELSQQVDEKMGIRITLYNWKKLNIKVGDKVLLKNVTYLEDGEYTITDVEDLEYTGTGIMAVDDTWIWLDDDDPLCKVYTA